MAAKNMVISGKYKGLEITTRRRENEDITVSTRYNQAESDNNWS